MPTPAPGEDLLLGEGDAKLLIRPAWRAGDVLGAKLATVFPANLAAGKLSVQALYALFDGRDGAPRAVIVGAPLTGFKTAADSALGSRLLARADCRTLLMVGAGALAPALIKAPRAPTPSPTWPSCAAAAPAVAATPPSGVQKRRRRPSRSARRAVSATAAGATTTGD